MIELESLKVLADLGSAGAVIIIAIVFIRYIKSRDEMAQKKDQEWRKIMTNHISEEIKAFTYLTNAINKVVEDHKHE